MDVRASYFLWSKGIGLFVLILIPCLAFLLGEFYHAPALKALRTHLYSIILENEISNNLNTGVFFIGCVAFIFVVVWWYLSRPRPVYLVDFSTFSPPENMKITPELFSLLTRGCPTFTQSSIDFQEKMLPKTGLGRETYFPAHMLNPKAIKEPQNYLSMARARDEAEQVITSCLDELFKTTHITAKDIDILIVNCSLFNPTPSIAEMAINKYKMRHNTLVYNLSGMGCSAGLLAIDLAKDLLQVHKNSLAVVISTENVTLNWYRGNEKSMLLQNALFRSGGAAILLSNKWSDSFRAKYHLLCTVRVHKGADDKAYRSVYQMEDPNGMIGVSLSRDLLSVAGSALTINLTKLGATVLPWSEQIKFFISLCWRKLIDPKKPGYVPDFKKAFDHWCIHAGGRAIIDGLEENLHLEPHHVEPSRATLYRYGNTSSSSVWYELAYIERMNSIKSGQRVCQIALGAGFQCNTAVWIRRR